MGWSNPWVIIAMLTGIVPSDMFPFIENRVESPMFRLSLFKNKMFAYANLAVLLGSFGRGGLMFMLVSLLQGIWLPLHGYSYSSTPFWAGVYMLPLTAGIVIMGPLSGILSDTYGPRWIATGGMVVVTISHSCVCCSPIQFQSIRICTCRIYDGCGQWNVQTPNTTSS